MNNATISWTLIFLVSNVPALLLLSFFCILIRSSDISGLVQDAGLDEEENQNSEDFHGSNAGSGADSSQLPQTPSSSSRTTV